MSSEGVGAYLREVAEQLQAIPVGQVQRAIDELARAYQRDATIFFVGNGGSASTASHFACDLGKSTCRPGRRRFRAISLCDNHEALSAWANDCGYDTVFIEQLAGLARPGDVLVAISVSGSSPNVVRGVEAARAAGLRTIGLLGRDGGRLVELVDVPLVVPCANYGQVESVHLTLHHLICEQLGRVVEP